MSSKKFIIKIETPISEGESKEDFLKKLEENILASLESAKANIDKTWRNK